MSLQAVADKLLAAALAYPGAFEDRPWGESVAKVGKKVFVFLGKPAGGEVGLSVKLPSSGAMALSLPFCEPTGYGLGKSGWVSASWTRARDVPMDMVLAWIDESYRAIAPKKLVAQLDAGEAAPKPKTKPETKPKTKAKKPAAAKPRTASAKAGGGKPSR